MRHHAGRSGAREDPVVVWRPGMWWSGAREDPARAGRILWSGAREDPVVVWRPGHKVLWDIKPYGVCRDALTLTVAVVNGYLKALTIEA